jgi:hypothetical protein
MLLSTLLAMLFLIPSRSTIPVPSPQERAVVHKDIIPSSYRVDSIHSYDVLSYKLDLSIDPCTEFIDGFAEIRCEIIYDPDTISFDFWDMVIETVLVDGSASAYDYGSGLLRVFPAPPPSIGDTVTVHVAYNGYPQIHSTPFWGEGIYFYPDVIFTLQCPEGSRYWYPSWDAPFDKATYEVSFTVPDTLFLCANGLLADSINTGGGTITYSWQHDYPVATYLHLFAASKYVQLHDTAGPVSIIHYVYPEDSANAVADFAIVPAAIAYYNSLFGPYPFEKFGYNESAVGGGMEHQTNVSLGSGFITGTGTYEWLFVHELSHMWWGDMVTLVDWRHCWLNEGFATYSEALWWEYLYGKPGLQSYVEGLQSQYIAWESGGHLFPVFDPPLEHLFSTTTYEKGACVLHMLRFLLGDSLFFETLRTYGNTFKYGNASTDDFSSIAEAVSAVELTWFFDQWIYGGGSPRFLYTVFHDGDSDSIAILTLSESNTQTDYHMDSEFLIMSGGGADSLLDTMVIRPYEREDFFGLQAPFDTIIFDEFGWILTRGFVHSLPELTSAIPGDGRVDLFWESFHDYTYNVFYSTDSLSGWMKANGAPFDSTHYSVNGLTNGQDYYFKLNAVNRRGFESDSSSMLSATPLAFPMDRGLLVVDETMDGNGSSPILPTDAMVDSFYEYCVSPVQFTQWDCAQQGLPPLDTIVHYGQVLWHDDDMGYSTIDELESDLITYGFNGGGFILSGWRTLNSFTPTMRSFYQIASAAEIPQPLYEGIYGQSGYNDVLVDSAKMIPQWNWMLNYGWYFDIAGGDTIALTESPDTLYDSLITGLRGTGGGHSHVVLGFPLYFMETEEAKTFLQKALVDIGAGITENSGKPVPRFFVGRPYPDPFRIRTRFALRLPWAEYADIEVFDASGRKVKDIHQGLLGEGLHTFEWNGRDDRGHRVANAVYFIRIAMESRRETRKIVLLR